MTSYGEQPNMSKGEELMKTLLDFWFPHHPHQDNRRPKWLEQLELDRLYPDLSLAFEFQGIQHITWTPKYQRTEQDFKVQQTRDKKKLRLCHANNVTLIWIQHWQLDFGEFRKVTFRYAHRNPHFEEIKRCVYQTPPSELIKEINRYIHTIEVGKSKWDLPNLPKSKKRKPVRRRMTIIYD